MEKDAFSLEGKTVLVTGASSGIGTACALECAKAGARLVVSGRDEGRLNAVLASLPGSGHCAVAVDLSTQTGVDQLVEQLPALDGLVHSAGVAKTVLLRFVSDADIEGHFSVNVFSAIWLTRALLKKRLVNKGGSLVYIASVNAAIAVPGNGIYSTTKSALVAFSRAVAVEVAPRGVRANTISPGMVETPMTDYIVKGDPEALKTDQAKYLLGYGKPADIGGAARYFLADASRWVTGSDFVIDGGFTAYR